jgi:EAL domain-containing protein (putative c-di-GMP-specific phosphodiesterase class I)/GGDEF domain-containing protein
MGSRQNDRRCDMKTYEFSADTRAFIENIPIPIAVYQYINDQIRPLLVSRAYLELFGYGSTQEAIYSLETDLYRNVHPEDIVKMEQYSYRFATEDGAYDVVFRNKREDQSECHLIHGTGRHITVDGASMAFITYTDETDDADNNQVVKAVLTTLSGKYSASGSTEFSKHYDNLTGLQNMTHFLDYAMTGIGKMWEKEQVPVIMYFNLCGLKEYNSRYGLKVGDKQICALANLIAAYFGRNNASRFESDHFVVFAENDQIEAKLNALFSQMNQMGGGNNLAVKTGIYRFENDGTRLTDACDNARLACKSISRTAASAFVWFDQTIRENASLKSHIMRNFDKALENGWIHVYYQPVVRAMTNTVCNCEALARWMDPEYGMISPGRFIPVLEETGQIYRLDLYMFEQVCRDYAQVKKNGTRPIPATVNLSRKDFAHGDLPDTIDRISQKYGVPREFTNLEITESAFVKNRDKADSFIRRFHQMGYKVWMDDFGSGYSSLGVLKNYFFDELKLDMSFLQDFDEKSRQVITAVVRMAKKLNISTLAEGVETEEQVLFLKKIGCEKIQGYYFARPMPMEKLTPHFENRGFDVEPAMWRSYLTKLSRIDYLTDQPLCVVDDDGARLKILFVNEAYKEILRRDQVYDLKDWERKLNTPGDPIHLFHRQYADQQLRKLKGMQTAVYPSGDHYMQLTGSVEAMQDSHFLYTIHIQYVEINAENFRQVTMEAMSDLYYMCSDIAIYDLEHSTVQAVKSSLSDQPMGTGAELLDLSAVIHSWKINYCYLPDQDRFAEFMDVSAMKSRLKQNQNHALMDMFRSITASGEYRWFFHIIIPMQRSDFNRALHVTIQTGLQEENLKKIASSLTDVAYGQAGTEMTEEVLWKNLTMNAKRMYFWKDDHRRFVGASESFLKYYNLHSEKEIIGKTDEDMMWHIDPELFKKDEEEVLRSGKKFYLRRGNCIVNGTNREILASKIPVYRDGRIAGILGNVIDAEDARRFFDEEKKRSSIDPVTGLANARGVSDSIYSYLVERWRKGTAFAMIEVFIPEYSEIVKLYGNRSGDCLLQEIGGILKKCGGTECVIGRARESYFYLLMKFASKEDVRTVAGKIRSGIESVRKAGEWSGNCSAVINASFTDRSSRDRDSYIRGFTGIILNSRDSEEL